MRIDKIYVLPATVIAALFPAAFSTSCFRVLETCDPAQKWTFIRTRIGKVHDVGITGSVPVQAIWARLTRAGADSEFTSS